jgi:hypothetical protein
VTATKSGENIVGRRFEATGIDLSDKRGQLDEKNTKGREFGEEEGKKGEFWGGRRVLWPDRDGRLGEEHRWLHCVDGAEFQMNTVYRRYYEYPCAGIGCGWFFTGKTERKELR